MRWAVTGALLTLVFMLVWFLWSDTPDHHDTGTAPGGRTATIERPRAENNEGPVRRLMRRPRLPENARITIRTGDDPADVRAGINRAELATRREWRATFTRAFERFQKEAELSDAQAQAVSLVLYDFQEIQRGTREMVRWERARHGDDPDALDRIHKESDRIYFDEVEWATDRLKGILSERQYSVWRDEMLPALPWAILEDYAPLVAEAREP